MPQPFSTHPVPFYRGPAEVAFGNEAVVINGNTAESAMQLGAWALHCDGSAVHQGAAGVLIDDATAYAVLSSRNDDQWGVTSEISVDFHSPFRPGILDSDFQLTVNIIHSSRSVVIAEVRNRNTDGKTITFGLVTLHRVSSI